MERQLVGDALVPLLRTVADQSLDRSLVDERRERSIDSQSGRRHVFVGI